MTRVLFICMGNICRSPTAEGVFRAQVQAAGLAQHIEIDSAGTHDYHVGAPPDARSQEHARQRGYELGGLRARQLVAADFERFDLLLAMDEDNLARAARLATPAQRARLQLFMRYAPGLGTAVPDPYYGGPEGFEQVLDLVEAAGAGLLKALRQKP
ncbi:low molecular weight protein-tyrosine-phosphatase [Inhella proteolytica]|uniref:protein-tyrosine-phosphatase n=1 Tax=Inhella proteolytica TaxID=2795029 RepID=A0A931J647_9BURK|nr:low molecular weight protein-tyrosine-phosphatase [Inhella proteolytica]MBH9578234.1 low molecular weight phosphotyrosine protein phosphatase [Inhella proteolytica]